MSATRYEVVFTGRVQGVFFRATCEELARRFAVTGWARNESDGSVRLIAEGEHEELDRFLAAVRDARRDYIDDVHITRSDPTGEFDAFRIRR